MLLFDGNYSPVFRGAQYFISPGGMDLPRSKMILERMDSYDSIIALTQRKWTGK